MQRFGMVIGIKSEKIKDYNALHAECWPGVLNTLTENGVRNFSIYLREPENLLFGYFEYVGENYAASARKIAECPVTQKWWTFTDPCQQPLASRAEDEWWAFMPSVFHMD